MVVHHHLSLSLADGVMISPPAGRDRGGGYHRHHDDHGQSQGGLDPVRAASQRVAVEAEPPDQPGQAPKRARMAAHDVHLQQAPFY